MWDQQQWNVSRGRVASHSTTPSYWQQLCKASCILEPRKLQKAIPFYFPVQYLAAALTEASEVYLGEEDGSDMVQKIAEDISEEEGLLRQCFTSTVPGDISVQSRQGTLLE